MTTKVVSDPSDRPLVVGDLFDFVRVNNTAVETDILTKLLVSAFVYAEGITGIFFGERNVSVSMDYLPKGRLLTLPHYPLSDLFVYLWDGSSFVESVGLATLVKSDNEYHAVCSNSSWPDLDYTNLVAGDPAVRFDFSAGYPSVGYPDEADELLLAIKQIVAYWYENRMSVVVSQAQRLDAIEVPMAAREILTDRSILK